MASANEKYKATQLWNDAIRAFRNQMPVKPHRKHFKLLPDTFTGAEAVDWLHGYLSAKANVSNKSDASEISQIRPLLLQRVTREQTLALLNKFCEQGLFERARQKAQEIACPFGRVKDDSTLYRFSNVSPSKIAGTPLALKINNSRLDEATVSSDCNKTPSKKALLNTRPVLAVTPISYRKLTDAETEAQRETNGLLKSKGNCPLIDQVIAIEGTTDVAACEKADARSETNTAFSSRQSSVRLKTGMATLEQQSGAGLAQLQLVARNLSCEEIENVWKTMALSSLRQLLRLDDSSFDGAQYILGQNICHNAKYSTPRGVTRVFSKLDDLPGWTLQAMKCLANWPWKNSELNWPCYPGFERDVFATVLDFFATQPEPLIPFELQELMMELLNRVEYLDVQRWDASHDELMQSPLISRRVPNGLGLGSSASADDDAPVETEFGSRSPITRLIEREPRSRASVASAFGSKQDDGLAGLRSELEANVRSLEEVLSSLPGLLRSPGVMRQLKEIKSKTGEAQSARTEKDMGQCLRTPGSPDADDQLCARIPPSFFNLPGARFSLASAAGSFSVSGSPPLISSIYEASLSFFTMAGRQIACKALQLCLLFLPPRNRRWLQLLLRMMTKICVNYCLRLDKHNNLSNRSIVLESFCDLIISANRDCRENSSTKQQRMKMTSFLLDAMNDVFSPPTELIAGVENRLRQIQRAKICYPPTGQENNVLSVRTDDTAFTYCERISPQQFEQQAMVSSRNALQKLLNSIADDNTLSGGEKRKRLKKFKASYPDLFYQRFPNKASFQSLIKTSHSLTKKDASSAKRVASIQKSISLRL